MILVDASYSVYYNGFAAWSWYKREFGTAHIPKDGSFDPMSDNEFKSMFETRYLQRIQQVTSNDRPFFDYQELVFCLDCHRNHIWRMDIYPQYKIERKQKQEKTKEFSWGGIFKYVINNMYPKYVEKGATVLAHDNCEGDDIIAIVANDFHNKDDILVVTCDFDISQLDDKCKIINLKGEQITIERAVKKYKLDKEFKWDKNRFLVHKAIMGDNGDEIPPIKPGLGPKRAFNYINNPQELQELLSDSRVKLNLIRNTKLVDFTYIPTLIKEAVLKQFNETRDESLTQL